MWGKLELYYEDTTASVQAALEGLQRLKPVKEEDYRALVELVDEVESVYSQLDELNRLSTLTMRDVDFISDLLPIHLKVDWRRKYRDLSPDDKLQPFKSFMTFLEKERAVVARLAENQVPKKRGDQWAGGSHHTERGNKPRVYHKCAFPTHRKDTIKHTTEQCKEFQKLLVSGKDGKYELLKQVNACFICFGHHKKQDCPKKFCALLVVAVSITCCCVYEESQILQMIKTMGRNLQVMKAKGIKKPLRTLQEVTLWLYILFIKQT